MTGEPGEGWDFFEAPAAKEAADEIALAYARAFGGPNGRVVLDHLRGLHVERALPSSATDAELRFAEGQRALVLFIEATTKRGTAT